MVYVTLIRFASIVVYLKAHQQAVEDISYRDIDDCILRRTDSWYVSYSRLVVA